jgi:hypothetical protein
MNRFLVAAGLVAVALACQAAHAAENAPENCFVAKAKAEARNAKAATDKALKLLRHHIADQHLIIPGGKKIGPHQSTASSRPVRLRPPYVTTYKIQVTPPLSQRF